MKASLSRRPGIEKLERVAVRCPIVLARRAGRATAISTNIIHPAIGRCGSICRLALPAITGAVPAELLSIDTDWTVRKGEGKAAKHVSFRRGSGGAAW